MALVILILLIETAAVLALLRLRTETIRRYPLKAETERALAFLLAVVLFTSLTFLFVFLGMGMIRYFAVPVAEGLWMTVTAILILSGAAGMLLLPGRRPAAVAAINLIVGLVSLLFWMIGRFI